MIRVTFQYRNQVSYSHKPMIGSTAKTPGVFKQREYQHLDGSRLLASIGKVGVSGRGENLLFLVAHLSVDVQTRKQQRLCFSVSSFQFSVRRWKTVQNLKSGVVWLCGCVLCYARQVAREMQKINICPIWFHSLVVKVLDF